MAAEQEIKNVICNIYSISAWDKDIYLHESESHL